MQGGERDRAAPVQLVRAGRGDYESVWNGRDELLHRSLAPEIPSKVCCLCWNRRPLSDFDKRHICRRCIRLRNSARLRKYREAARANRVCQVCLKRQAVAGLTICERCQAGKREQSSKRRRRLLGESRCVDCTASLPPGWKAARCRACVDGGVARHPARHGVVSHLRQAPPSGTCRRCSGHAMPALSGPGGRTPANASRRASKERGSSKLMVR